MFKKIKKFRQQSKYKNSKENNIRKKLLEYKRSKEEKDYITKYKEYKETKKKKKIILPNIKNTKKQRRSTFPSMGRVSSNSITSIRIPITIQGLTTIF